MFGFQLASMRVWFHFMVEGIVIKLHYSPQLGKIEVFGYCREKLILPSALGLTIVDLKLDFRVKK